MHVHLYMFISAIFDLQVLAHYLERPIMQHCVREENVANNIIHPPLNEIKHPP